MAKLLPILVTLLLFFQLSTAQTKNEFQNKFLIVLDVQEAYTEVEKSKEEAAKMIDAINSLIDEVEPSKVIYVTSIPRVLVLTMKGIRIDTLENIAIDSRVKRVSNFEFVKSSGDAFAEQDLIDFLQKGNAEEIILTGLLADKCVKASLLGGVEKGYKMYVHPDAILAKSEKSKNKVLNQVKRKGVLVL